MTVQDKSKKIEIENKKIETVVDKSKEEVKTKELKKDT